MIHCVVCIRPLSDSTPVQAGPAGEGLSARPGPVAMNPDDKAGVEAALRLKEAEGGDVAVFCAGPESSVEILREALAMGCDEAVLTAVPFPDCLCAETAAKALAEALKDKTYNLILTGGQALDSTATQTGPLLAEALSLPQLTQARTLSLTGRQAAARCSFGSREALLKAPLPCLVTVTDKLAEPRYPTFMGITGAYGKPLRRIEYKGEDSALCVKALVNRQRGRQGQMVRKEPPEAAARLLSFIRDEGLL
ncbi:electron transfer flavoprotein subunit beta [Eubacterium sp. 1001713B170207_170306_E7]|uniref:electron transfer flavoprotein subunit beta/FixA family protein n=1 Tax=Eubacterium sp. 1001713B170207_170306_E7 TaxID=2787097 RepID=UPI001897BF6D|nr:electron transfer flavoprotein subunit beta [Eubacterium sp. 1001713B170207_170306_E7]